MQVLNLNQSPDKIAEEAKNNYESQFEPSFSEQGKILRNLRIVGLAINLLYNMLQTTDKFRSTYRAHGSNAYYLEPNPNFTNLSSAIEILKNELK